MKATVNSLSIIYPDLGFAFNPIRVFIDGFTESSYVVIEANNIKIERETSPTSRNISFDLSAIAKSLFDRLEFYKVEEQDTTLFKTIDFTLSGKDGVFYEGSIPVIWGALQIAEQYSQSKTLTYFKGFPFTLPLTLDRRESIYMSIDNNDAQFVKSCNRGKWNLNIPVNALQTIEVYIGRPDGAVGVFDRTFDLTFRPKITIGNIEPERIIKIADCPNDGVYLRWINKYGEYNYYLFQSSNKTATTKNNDIKYDNVYYATDLTNSYHHGTGKNIGKNIEQSMKLFAHLIDSETVDLLQHLVESPVVDMFLGYDKNNSAEWVSVNIQEGAFAKSSAALQDFEFFLIPNNKLVQTL